jgi:peptidoglycan/LPS O-acetylase OafA/YrhL
MVVASMTQIYRPDVDGLRAVAVLAVLAFHAFPQLAPGGFAGVDIFFVISGFLISGIILEGLRDGSFSFAEFYWRRVRRIFPALILVLLACLAIGWLILLPHEFRQLGAHVAAGAAFVSNVLLWRESGYFDTAAQLKPLLHLWSLGVEEQYYIVWPVALFLLRARPRLMLVMIVGVAAASFAANLVMTANARSAAFFLPFGRFWELMAGGALAYAARHGRLADAYRDTKAWTGLALLLASLALLHEERSFPGGWALLPVVGTVLVIWAGPGAWLNRHVLSRPALVWVGLISYPLYLWHWPLLAYARIAEGGEPSATARLGLCALSLLLAWLTYELVEKKIRFSRPGSARRIFVPALVAFMATIGAGGVLALRSMLAPHSASLPLAREISEAHTDWDYASDRIILGDTGKAVLFFGDSHMQHYWPRVHKIMQERTVPVHTVIFKTAGGCAPVPGIERKGRGCSRFVEEGVDLARSRQVETVVIAASWVGFVNRGDYYKVGDGAQRPLRLLASDAEWVMQRFEAALRELTAAGKKVVIVLSSPRGNAFDPMGIVERDGMMLHVRGPFPAVPRNEIAALASPIDERLKRIASAVGATIVDPADSLCTASLCPAADENGRPLYKDASHLRASVARERFRALDPYLYLR